MVKKSRLIAIILIAIFASMYCTRLVIRHYAEAYAEQGRQTMLYFDSVKQEDMADISGDEIIKRIIIASKARNEFINAIAWGADVDAELSDAEMKHDIYVDALKERIHQFPIRPLKNFDFIADRYREAMKRVPKRYKNLSK